MLTSPQKWTYPRNYVYQELFKYIKSFESFTDIFNDFMKRGVQRTPSLVNLKKPNTYRIKFVLWKYEPYILKVTS